MDIKVVASTKIGYQAEKREFDRLGGLAAGVCYLPDTTDKLFGEDEEKTFRRVKQILSSGHHSPFDHSLITLELVDIPKIVAMYLNNEKMYTTSEKSARYKRMKPTEEESAYYNKWLKIFEEEITKAYGNKNEPFFEGNRITKLAQENARYLTSVFTPTTMEYTISYRQLNVLYSLIEKEISLLENEQSEFGIRLKKELLTFKENLSALPYIEPALADQKNRHLSLIEHNRSRKIIKQYGDVYQIAYLGSFAQLAQAQRHRTINYKFQIPEKTEFYVPPILKNNAILSKAWIEDCQALAKNCPQGMLVKIIENGQVEDLILKAKERKCSFAQLEIDNQTTSSLKEIYEELKKQDHPAAEEIKPYAKTTSRCTFKDYTCPSPCKFQDGVRGERII